MTLGLASEDAVRAGFDALGQTARKSFPGAEIDGVLVQEMLSGGQEVIVGLSRDPQFGPVVMFGLGGIFVEALGDVVFRAAPFDLDEAHRMIREIRAFKVLEGVRGRPPADLDALAAALVSLSGIAIAHGGAIESIDINPFLVRAKGEGALALDALVIGRKA